MKTPEDNQVPQAPLPAPAPKHKADPDLIRNLQGEDGYEIFNDDKAADTRERLRQEQEDARW